MEKWISPMEKRNFLKWFMENHRLKRTDSRKVLDYMINHYPFLENLSFTEKIPPNKKTIVVSSMNSDEPGFIFYHHHIKSEDVSLALGNIMMNPSEKINMIIHFNGKMFNQRYLQLVENPGIESMKIYEQHQKFAKEADKLFEKVKMEKEIELLKKQIDQALDQRDKELFTLLTDKLNKLVHNR